MEAHNTFLNIVSLSDHLKLSCCICGHLILDVLVFQIMFFGENHGWCVS
jgi:hypothetical protein